MLHIFDKYAQKPTEDYLRYPVETVNRASADQIVDFVQLIGTFSIDTVFTNLDATNTATVYLNGEVVGRTIPAGASVVWNNVFISRIRVVSHATTGSWQIMPNVIRRDTNA